jgi:tripartite-type tricarboxylate transporter receptor subunit TctC
MNIRELVALAKSKPGQINFASSGSGSVGHLATELFASMAGIKMNHIPYKGTGPALTDTIAGQTTVLFSTTAIALPYVKSGRLRGLAVSTTKRIPAASDIPTVAESGVPGYEVVVWHGLNRSERTAAPDRGTNQQRSNEDAEANGNSGKACERWRFASRWQARAVPGNDQEGDRGLAESRERGWREGRMISTYVMCSERD